MGINHILSKQIKNLVTKEILLLFIKPNVRFNLHTDTSDFQDGGFLLKNQTQL